MTRPVDPLSIIELVSRELGWNLLQPGDVILTRAEFLQVVLTHGQTCSLRTIGDVWRAYGTMGVSTIVPGGEKAVVHLPVLISLLAKRWPERYAGLLEGS